MPKKTKKPSPAKKKSPKKKTAVKAATKATAKTKKAPAKKKAPAVKKSAAKKKTPAKKKASVKKTPAKKKASVKKTPAKKATTKKATTKKATKTVKKAGSAPAKKGTKKAGQAKAKSSAGKQGKSQLNEKARALFASRSAREKNATPILFSFDDATALLASRKKDEGDKEKPSSPAAAPAKPAKKSVEVSGKPEKKRVHAAASLADILGFDPAKKKKETELEESSIPTKWKKYYRLLIELRQHVKEELDLHTADTLKHSSREDSGDLSGYGLHQADSGTDNFDRDFALSLVSNEQDALYEIEEAIQRIKAGTYGVCEVTGKKIDVKRLTAVPFTRFSVEGQSEYEKNKRRKVARGGTAFGESGDIPALPTDDGDD